MRETILTTLRQIEIDYKVKILYACESGSRAWGFASKDSDYDVRFLYVHKKEDYLTIDPIGTGKKRDVIELPINDLLDVSGWELTKALRLFRKSNPHLMEWLRSELVYFEAFSTIQKLKELSPIIFAPQSCLYHYLNMADTNFRDHLQGSEVKIKIYFYALRGVLAARWIEKYKEFPPLEFPVLVENLLAEGDLMAEIKALLTRKLHGEELDKKPRIETIHHFLAEELIRLREYAKTLTTPKNNYAAKLDTLFRETLDEVWSRNHHLGLTETK